MKKLISGILAVILLLSLPSCATTPSKEPNTPATPETPSPETAEQTAPSQTEHTFGYLPVLCSTVSPECKVEEGISVIRSLDELEPLVTATKEGFALVVEEMEKEVTLASPIHELAGLSKFLLVAPRLNERFFEEKQLVLLSFSGAYGAEYARPLRVYSEDGILVFELQLLFAADTGRNEAIQYYAVMISLDKDVKVEAGKIKMSYTVATNEIGDLWVDYER